MDSHPDPDAGAPLPPEQEPPTESPMLALSDETPAASGEPEPSDSLSPEDEGAEEPAAPPSQDDPLHQLAEEASHHRLSPADEERATGLLKEALVDGRVGVTRSIDALPRLPWLVGVNAVSAVWLEMKPTFRTRLLAGLARVDTDAARRVRLSLARGLFKQDIPAALKIAVSVAKDIRDKETGLVGQKDAHAFSNVFIGRAKPWVAQMPLADLKPAESDVVLHAALMVVFGLPHPPATQLGILKWGATAGRLGKLHPAALEAITKGLGRWNGKWRQTLYTEVQDLPEEIARLVLPPVREITPVSPRREAHDREPRRDPPIADETARDIEDLDDEDEDDERERHEKPEPPEGAITAEIVTPERRERPVYESKTVPQQGRRQPNQNAPAPAERRHDDAPPQGRRGQPPQHQAGGSFNLPDALRQIEHHVSGLRSELQAAQNKLRQRDDEGRRAKPAPVSRAAAPVIAGEPTPDELARLNLQLEARNTELQTLLDELREDSEARAASAEAPADAASPSGDAPLRALLQLKLQEDFEDYLALNSEAPDVVVQQHYRSLLGHVFQVLRQEGVPLKEAAPR